MNEKVLQSLAERAAERASWLLFRSGAGPRPKRGPAPPQIRFRHPEQIFIHKMTNWQRNQWARAGYKKGRIEEFLALQRQ